MLNAGYKKAALEECKKAGEEYQEEDNSHIQGQHGGEKLQLGHPSPPVMQGSAKLQKQERDSPPEHQG